MRRHAARRATIVLFAAVCALARGVASAADDPKPGIPGKDVVWIPTPQALVDRMLDMAKVTAADTVIDLGSGDGRTVIAAVKRGATALGIEYNPELVEMATRNAAREGLAGKARFERADIFQSDFSPASVITMFLLPSLNLRLRPRLLEMPPGTRIVSNSFTMGDWQEDEKSHVSREAGCDSGWCTAYLWIVPARFDGTHRLPEGDLTLQQEFQVLIGTLQTAAGEVPARGIVRGTKAYVSAGGLTLRASRSGTRIKFLP